MYINLKRTFKDMLEMFPISKLKFWSFIAFVNKVWNVNQTIWYKNEFFFTQKKNSSELISSEMVEISIKFIVLTNLDKSFFLLLIQNQYNVTYERMKNCWNVMIFEWLSRWKKLYLTLMIKIFAFFASLKAYCVLKFQLFIAS